MAVTALKIEIAAIKEQNDILESTQASVQKTDQGANQ